MVPAELFTWTAAAGAIDGVLPELHGSMMAEGIDDADGHILQAVRRVAGSGVPILPRRHLPGPGAGVHNPGAGRLPFRRPDRKLYPFDDT